MVVHVLSGDSSPPERASVIEDSTCYVVEVSGDPTVIQVVEPVAVNGTTLGLELDDIADVAAGLPPHDVPLSLILGSDGMYRLVAASGTADTFLLRNELGRPNGVARLDANGLLRADERPPSSYHHEQIGVSTVWAIPHMLSFDPAGIEVFDPLGHRHYPKTISHPEPGLTVLTFAREIRGTAELS